MFFEELTLGPELLHIVCEEFKIDHSSKNIKLTKLKDIFSSYNLSNMSNVGNTRESAKSRTNIDVVYCSKTVEIEIIKSAVTDNNTVQIVFSDYVGKSVPLKNKVYRDWTVLENHLFLEKKLCKKRDKLGRTFMLWIRDLCRTFMLWIVILHLRSSKRLTLRKLTIKIHRKNQNLLSNQIGLATVYRI